MLDEDLVKAEIWYGLDLVELVAATTRSRVETLSAG